MKWIFCSWTLHEMQWPIVAVTSSFRARKKNRSSLSNRHRKSNFNFFFLFHFFSPQCYLQHAVCMKWNEWKIELEFKYIFFYRNIEWRNIKIEKNNAKLSSFWVHWIWENWRGGRKMNESHEKIKFLEFRFCSLFLKKCGFKNSWFIRFFFSSSESTV